MKDSIGKEWALKRTFTREGKHFRVAIEHRPEVNYRGEESNKWNVYAYIFPKHPMFGKFEGDEIYQDATRSLPLHWGCTFLRWHRDRDGTPFSVQVGSDYQHCDDDRFDTFDNLSDAYEVVNDAAELFEYLSPARSEVEA